ncbi:hypothetical protein EV356DRAFT_497838 [Viridothelium virens]|uniref:Uncharacterized protein n=1 Tax=Viridothelium virens TaxID=1048519 RepID=A0A6A6GSC9_VIRVR|nr:hypothetical protein EV356DRAFT_497838 [Viridothelium virens]
MALRLRNVNASMTGATSGSVSAGLQHDADRSGSIQNSSPKPRTGSTFLIKLASSGEFITLFEGQIVLALPHGRESHWMCVGDEEWSGFKNLISGRFLGRDEHWRLVCDQKWHREWEKFRVKERRGGGSVLIMKHWSTLRPIGTKMENDVEKLAMIENWESDEMIWEFIEA